MSYFELSKAPKYFITSIPTLYTLAVRSTTLNETLTPHPTSSIFSLEGGII